ncbi:hypothetical protein ACFLT7_03590 [candidate division KSB1 bacterium]
MNIRLILSICGGIFWLGTGAGQAAADEAKFPSRILYAPAHFGNSYEVMGENEMREALTEAVHWGFNIYTDWFDMIDCSDPFQGPWYNLGDAVWDRKKANFRSAELQGLKVNLCITPNHVYFDQLRPDLLATKKKGVFGQLICPSIPQARETILNNYRNIFRDLQRAGVSLDGLFSFAYDYGGCACEKCDPWILTFARLVRDIHGIGREYHPDLEANFCGWWWSEEEHSLFADWADANTPDWVKSIAMFIPFDAVSIRDVALPTSTEVHAFVHIGYADGGNPRDLYGHLGPVVAPVRLPSTLNNLAKLGVSGLVAYSEGVFDDANKAILAGMASGKYDDVSAVLGDYAIRYFGAEGDAVDGWAQWLSAWGAPFDIDHGKAEAEFLRLRGGSPPTNHHIEGWALKPELFRHNAVVMGGDTWTRERLAAVERFWTVQEKLYREVWGLGLLRHVMARDDTPLPWHKDWEKYVTEHPEARVSR